MSKRQQILVTIDSTPLSDEPLVLSRAGQWLFIRGIALPLANSARATRLQGQGGTGGYVYDIPSPSDGDLPPGISLDGATGILTGTPTATGLYVFTAEVQDSSATVATAVFSIRVEGQLVGVNIDPVPGEVGAPYSYQFTVRGNTGTVTWSHVSGTLPDSCSLSSDGSLTGTPTIDGFANFIVRATDGGSGDTLDVPCRVFTYEAIRAEIVEAFLGVDVAMLELPAAKRGVPTIYHARQIGGIPGAKFYVDDLPSGIACDPITGVIGGITYDPAFYGSPLAVPAITLHAVSLSGQASSESFHLPVREAENIQQFQKDGTPVGYQGAFVYNFKEGVGIDITITPFVDKTGVDIEFSATGGGGVGISSINGILPDSSGDFQIVSRDGTVDIGQDSNGDFNLSVTGIIGAAGPRPLGISYDNGDIAISGSLLARDISAPNGGTVVGWVITGGHDIAGSVSIAVSKAAFTTGTPTFSPLFTATCTSAKQAISGAISNSFSANDIFRFDATGFANFKSCALILKVT